jgi:phage baseplate assembly protein W
MTNYDFLGQDLALGFVADENGTTVAGPFSHPDLQAVQHGRAFPRAMDLDLVTGLANFVQSLITRLETERGELAALGHPNYGSRHHQLIGEPNTEPNRNLVKLYVLECLKQDARIAAIDKIDVKPGQGRENKDKVEVTIALRVQGVASPLNFVVPFSFAGPL